MTMCHQGFAATGFCSHPSMKRETQKGQATLDNAREIVSLASMYTYRWQQIARHVEVMTNLKHAHFVSSTGIIHMRLSVSLIVPPFV